MRVITSLADLRGEYQNVVLTLGNFDGIHLGHQAVLQQVVARAKEFKTISVVFTFQEHPLKLLAPDKAPALLATMEEKVALLESLGIDVVVSIPFDRQIASTSADSFIRDIIYNLLSPCLIIVGHDYAFGKNRSGDVELLRSMGVEYGFQVQEFDAVGLEGTRISSTVIRQKIQQGKVQEAAKLLGRAYSLRSRVIAGQQKGKELNCSTANVELQSKLLPACGVYAVRVRLEDRLYEGVANIGYQPTYGKNELQLEVHLLDFEGNLYGAELEVAFIARLRAEKKFPSVDVLKKQIVADISQARQILAA